MGIDIYNEHSSILGGIQFTKKSGAIQFSILYTALVHI